MADRFIHHVQSLYPKERLAWLSASLISFASQTLTTGSFSAKIEYEYKFNFIAHSEVCMATIASLSAFQEVSLPQGTVRYYDQGTGPTLVFMHGLLANRLLWSRVIPQLVSHFRCIAPDLPLGAHSHPLHPDVDLSPLGVAHLVADFLEACDLHEVTLIGNDTGGAMCQLVIAHHPERISRLVLTNCDAFEQFFPPLVSPFQYGARVLGIRSCCCGEKMTPSSRSVLPGGSNKRFLMRGCTSFPTAALLCLSISQRSSPNLLRSLCMPKSEPEQEWTPHARPDLLAGQELPPAPQQERSRRKREALLEKAL